METEVVVVVSKILIGTQLVCYAVCSVLIKACHQWGSFISHMNPAVFLVAKEEFSKGHKNTATLLGLHRRPQEGSGPADRMFFFSSPLGRRSGSLAAVICEWS